VGLEIKALSVLGSRHIRHLIEHKLRGNPAHSLQHVAQARTDFQFAHLNSSNRFAGKHSVLQSALMSRFSAARDQQKLDVAKRSLWTGC
jgi:hypothetical protein